MSKRITELTDPGPPPEDVLDATLRALGNPARPPPRQASESGGVDAAQYQADAHFPPKAQRPNGPINTLPMLRPPTESETRETVREARSPGKGVHGLNLTTVPRGVPRGSKSGRFVVALLLVLLVVGGATWNLSARDEAHGVPRSIPRPVTPPSAAAMAVTPNAPPTADTAPSSVPAAAPPPMSMPRSTPRLAASEPSANATTTRPSSLQSPFEPRPAAAPVASGGVASPVNTDKPVPTLTVAPPARPSASSRDDIPKDPL